MSRLGKQEADYNVVGRDSMAANGRLNGWSGKSPTGIRPLTTEPKVGQPASTLPLSEAISPHDRAKILSFKELCEACVRISWNHKGSCPTVSPNSWLTGLAIP